MAQAKTLYQEGNSPVRTISHYYEVEILIKGRVTTRHYERHFRWQAMDAGSKLGKVLGCRKIPRDEVLLGTIKNIKLDEPMVEFVKDNPYVSPIAMDELIWNKKAKRAERRENNLEKDKEAIDTE